MTRKASDFHSGQRVTGQDHGTERTGVVVRIGTGLVWVRWHREGTNRGPLGAPRFRFPETLTPAPEE